MKPKTGLEIIQESNDYIQDIYKNYTRSTVLNFKNAKRPELTLPCRYHQGTRMSLSKENKLTWICCKCKEEKIPGRDGIYGAVEIHEMIEDLYEKNQGQSEKISFKEECAIKEGSF